MPRNDWNEYRRLFLNEMKENGEKFEHIVQTLDSMSTRMAKQSDDILALKVKAAIAGGTAGVVGTAAMTLLFKAWHF